jgi:hypothetical protein|eukprot:gnl/Ergobibamus_cyprinoides/1891.p2 GENE.gnl/Ergobibamus_cyprinoides/1891~~gnl/Ergobibamus_cyprinoides/1891.p2  ORF type:complete len:171 (+),score=64.33 gnl/Ergobibamus_cyprinoides/1891:327-839(+)
MHVRLVQHPEDYPAAVQEAIAEHPSATRFALFTGEDWCSDCEAAEAYVLDRIRERFPDCVVLRCAVERLPFTSDPNYAYCRHPLIHLRRVPTLIWLTATTKRCERLVEWREEADLVAFLAKIHAALTAEPESRAAREARHRAMAAHAAAFAVGAAATVAVALLIAGRRHP